MSKRIYLVESFYSVQGEGLLSGTPSIFLRFGGCNLRCEGFGTKYNIDGTTKFGCDSYYAVDKYFAKNWKSLENLNDLKNILNKYPQNIKDIIITGGEPLIYSKNNVFLKILDYFQEKKFRVTIETNGTIFLNDKDEFKNIYFSIALKLSNSKEEFNKRFNLDSIHSIINKSENSFFKFTIDKQSLLENKISEIFKIRELFPKTPIFCMPIGSNQEELEENSEAVVNFCLENNFIYSDRLQIRIWNNKKGY